MYYAGSMRAATHSIKYILNIILIACAILPSSTFQIQGEHLAPLESLFISHFLKYWLLLRPQSVTVTAECGTPIFSR